MEKQNDQSRMDRIVSLAKRRGFIFQSSEIYGGLNGFWDYGPLGVALKRNVKDCWWRDMVAGHDELATIQGAPSPYEMAGLDCTIIMHPQVWKCSGHFDLFHDWMIDCRDSKRRYRYDHLNGRWASHRDKKVFVTTDQSGDEAPPSIAAKAQKFFGLRAKQVDEIEWMGGLESLAGSITARTVTLADVLGPDAAAPGTLTEPREFNLMFETRIGAVAGNDDDRAFLRPETAQGIFVNFKNVVDTSRVRVPFGIGQIGKSFRNEITPGNFIFRTREFEQMEMEFFVEPDTAAQWHQYWIDTRLQWYIDLGINRDNLRLFEHPKEKLSHYSAGTTDIEYRFGFGGNPWGELEGVANRTDFDLKTHSQHSGTDLSFFDQATDARYVPYVIEPAAGLTRSFMAFLIDAYAEDEAPNAKGGVDKRTVLRLDPRLAPVKAAVLPLSRHADLSPKARDLAAELRKHWNVEFDDAGAIGRRYRRQDEIGTPFCVTVDFDTLEDQAVTVRDRDAMTQERVGLDAVVGYLATRLIG